MSKKTTILIVVLAIVSGILIFLAIRNEKSRTIEQKPKAVTPTSVPTLTPFAMLSFSTQSLDVSSSTAGEETVDVMINTSGKPVIGAQVELLYDPKLITDMKIVSADVPFFGSNALVLIKEVDDEQGRVSYALSLPSQDQEKAGQGKVMSLKFKVAKNATEKNTTINFLPKSMIMSLKSHSTVLEQTVPLSIILSK